MARRLQPCSQKGLELSRSEPCASCGKPSSPAGGSGINPTGSSVTTVDRPGPSARRTLLPCCALLARGARPRAKLAHRPHRFATVLRLPKTAVTHRTCPRARRRHHNAALINNRVESAQHGHHTQSRPALHHGRTGAEACDAQRGHPRPRCHRADFGPRPRSRHAPRDAGGGRPLHRRHQPHRCLGRRGGPHRCVAGRGLGLLSATGGLACLGWRRERSSCL